MNHDLVLAKATNFFGDYNNFKRIQHYVDKSKANANGLSLRVIEWFVNNYCENNYTKVTLPNGSYYWLSDINNMYKEQLKAYSKKLFDPFRRNDKFEFYIDTNTSIVTTTAQLNFFYWAINTTVLDFVENNAEWIKELMMGSKRKKDNKGLYVFCGFVLSAMFYHHLNDGYQDASRKGE